MISRMQFLLTEGLSPPTRELYRRLLGELVLFDLEDPAAVETLRGDVERIARDMDRADRPPPMLWSGIPWPQAEVGLSGDYCLTISIGGTKTEFFLLRLEEGRVVGVDEKGREVGGAALMERREAFSLPTPTAPEVASGLEMVERVVRQISGHLAPHRSLLDRCEHILLSWGFPSKTVRNGSRVLGGVTAISTLMTKEQACFTPDLKGKDIGRLFANAFRRELDWSRAVTVANDSVMALHYFLAPERRRRHQQIGLFINGTGSNFCLAERYAVRRAGVVSAAGESYEPERITALRPLGDGEVEERYLVNYESGSTDLQATRTRHDVVEEYPMEMNALAGGNAFEQQLRGLVGAHLGPGVHERLLRSWVDGGGRLAGPEVSRVAAGSPADVARLFPGADLGSAEREAVWLIARAIVLRSALHAALVLAAVTRRTGFGLGDAESDRTDLLGMEGSVWKSPRYPELVRECWGALVRPETLRLSFDSEPDHNASLAGPVYMTVLHE
jgi:hypothetical protein